MVSGDSSGGWFSAHNQPRRLEAQEPVSAPAQDHAVMERAGFSAGRHALERRAEQYRDLQDGPRGYRKYYQRRVPRKLVLPTPAGEGHRLRIRHQRGWTDPY